MKTHTDRQTHTRSAAEPADNQEKQVSGSALRPPRLQIEASDPPVQRREEEAPEQEETGAIPFKEQFEAMIESEPVDVQALRASVQAASDQERESVWLSQKLMKKAHQALSRDTYLILLTDLQMFKSGSGVHPPEVADAAIQAHLGAYVADAILAGKQIEGMVAVVSSIDWDRAGEAHYGEEAWKSKRDKINGFVDSMGKAWIHREKGEPGTMIHEAIHIYSDGILEATHHELNEGITEYFTRFVCSQLPNPIQRSTYQEQYSCVKSLTRVITEANLAAVYFNGDMSALTGTFIAAKSKEEWIAFHRAMKARDWTEARRICSS